MKIKAGRFFKNAAILTLTALLLRLAGMLFRVWMANRIGSEGMGLYQLIFSVYMLASTFAGVGICTAVTRLVTEAIDSGRSNAIPRIMARALMVTIIASIVSSVAIFALAEPIAIYWIKDARATISLKILCFSLPFMGISSCIRGYFVAQRRVLTPSNAQLFEQFVRMGIIMLIIGSSCDKGIEFSCGAVLFGDTVAEASSCLFSWVGYIIDRRGRGRPIKKQKDMVGVVKRLLHIALPITAGRYLTTTLRTIESLMVPDRLTIFSSNRALSLSQYGDLKGMAMPILFFPASFLTALSTLLVPELSGASASGDRERVSRSVRRCVSMTLNSSMIVAGLFMLFGNDIGLSLYGQGEVGFYIKTLAPMVPLMYLESVATGCLNGLDQQISSLRYNIVDSTIRIALIWFLLPNMGMHGFVLIMIISNSLTSMLSVWRLLSVAEVKFDAVDWLIRPMVLTALSLGGAYGVHLIMSGLSPMLRCVAECSVGGIIYLFLQLGKIKKEVRSRKQVR